MMFKRKRKIFKTSHSIPMGDMQCGFILLPLGYYYNVDFLRATRGDIIRFADGEKHRILCIRRMDLDDELTEHLCFMRYGFPVKVLMDMWLKGTVYDGSGRRAISDTECLFIGYGKETI